jgi:hypothetical protein
VIVHLGDRTVIGKVTDVTAQSLEVTVPIDLDLGVSRVSLTWPSRLSQEVDLAQVPRQTQLILKVPIESVPEPAEAAPAPMPAVETPMSQIKSEMRRSVRIPIEVAVVFTDPQTRQAFPAMTQDVSAGGTSVTSDQLLGVGKDYDLTLPLGEEPIVVKARVLRRLASGVYAVRFLCDREVGTKIMRALFQKVRGDQPQGRPNRMNFRRP